jgi:hypothetical protein
MLEGLGYEDDLKDTIVGSYALCGAAATDLNFRVWKDLAWATFFHTKGQSAKGHVGFLPFRETKADEAALVQEIAEARSTNAELNGRFEDPDQLAGLLVDINDAVYMSTSLLDFAFRVSYRDQVVTVWTDFQRDRFQGNVRANVRRLIEAQVGGALDIDVQLVLHWGAKQGY